MNASPLPRHFFCLFVLIGILLNATALFNEILEPDGALYAAIAKHMALTHDWVNLYGNGSDWLDKPHLPFWLAALSFQCLGISAFAYKLPALLCWAAGAYYTYLLAARLYNRPTAQWSVLIYITALHTLLANFDVRAEAYLGFFVIAAIYHLLLASGKPVAVHVLAASAYSALAIMTKGIFVLIVITAGFIGYWLFTGQWRQFIRPRWWIVLLLTLLFITPELYCLYRQFDQHPEKMVFGRTGVSGIRFFFWDSQFGRFFNSGPIKGRGDVFFFFHTLAWAFLPWSVPLYAAVARRLVRTGKYPPQHPQRWIAWAAAGTAFLVFSVSAFQLPHYIVILFPLLAMITAQDLLQTWHGNGRRWIRPVQLALFGLLAVLLPALVWFSRIGNPYLVTAWAILMVLAVAGIARKTASLAVLCTNTCFALLLFGTLNLVFYPALLRYQGGMQAGKWLQKQPVASRPVMFRCNNYAFEFYAPSLVARAADSAGLRQLCTPGITLAVLLPQAEWTALQATGLHIQRLAVFPYFHISQLNGRFINPATRSAQLQQLVLAKVSAALP